MKKLLCVLLAILACLFLVACGGDEESSSSYESSAEESSSESEKQEQSSTEESTNDEQSSSSEEQSSSETTVETESESESESTVETESESESESETVEPEKQDFVGITFKNDSFEYDEQAHKITITGNIPTSATITYSGGEDGKNGAISVGKYEITATVTADGYNTLVLKATLEITSKEETLSVLYHNGKVYFQNNLDKKTMYAYNGTSVEKLNKDNPTNMLSVGSNIFYVNKSILSSSISVIDSSGKISDLLEVSASELISDGTYLYYSVNSVVSAEKSGIYKAKISDLLDGEKEITPTKLTGTKSEYLAYSDGYIYFANKKDGGKLYAISVNASNAEPTLIYDYKVTDIIADDSTLYFTRCELLSAAIYSIDVSGGLHTTLGEESDKVTKITMSKGKYLAKIGDDIYFVNTDMATSAIFGDGIYKASADGSGWIGDAFTLLIGSTKVVDGEDDNIYSLSTDGTYLYYFRASTKHLYRYDIENEQEKDLMAGFVAPVEEKYILTYYEKATEYNGEIYYINMLDGGKLYKYNIAKDEEYRITGTQVADFAIYEGNLYYTTVKLLVNFDLYKMSLTNGEPERISTEKCMNMSFSGDKMYYTNYSGDNTLNSMNLDGTNDTILYGDPDKDEEKVSAGETTVYDGNVYFVANDQMYRYNIASGTAELVNKNLKPLEYLIYDGKILVMNCDGLKNHVDIYDIEKDEFTKLTDLGISGISDDARGMFLYNGEFYYYRNVAAGSSNKGLYRVYFDGDEYTQELVDEIDGYYMCESIVIGNKVYFLDVWQVKDSLPTASSTANIYSIDLSKSTITVTKEN